MTFTADKSPSQGGTIFDFVERGLLLLLNLSTIVRLAPEVLQTP